MDDGPPIYCPECEEPNTRNSARCCVCRHPLRAIVRVQVVPQPLSRLRPKFRLSRTAKVVGGLGLLGLIPLSIYTRPKPIESRRAILEVCVRDTLLRRGHLPRDAVVAELLTLAETLIDRGGDSRIVCLAVATFPDQRHEPPWKWDGVVETEEREWLARGAPIIPGTGP